MTTWKPTAEYKRICEANREFYALTAEQYDATETCVVDPRVQSTLDADLDHILAVLGPSDTVRALDACGGSGNIAIKLMTRGVDVLVVDISPDLLKILQRRCADAGLVPRVQCAEIGSYLAGTSESFDLVTFSSALHHLEAYRDVLGLAIQRLKPGGLLFTAFDPTPRGQLSRLSRALLRSDYYAFKALRQSSDLPRAIGRRLRRIARGVGADRKSEAPLDSTTAGMLAEYHVERGIDDLALEEFLVARGMEVVWHRRSADARFAVTRWLLRSRGEATTFKLLVRKAEAA